MVLVVELEDLLVLAVQVVVVLEDIQVKKIQRLMAQ
jgi:hypothetical protein